MSIVTTLSEQCALGFTGKVNILLKENGQYVGDILLLDGVLVGATYNQIHGPSALFRMVFDDHESNFEFKIVVEPEIVESNQKQFELAFENFKKKSEENIQKHIEAKSLRPPNHLKLKIRPEFVAQGEEITLNEFEILCSLIGKNTVGELYDGLSLEESDITNALVSLRKKNAVLVVNQN